MGNGGYSFMIASDCADWWEVQNKAYHEQLEQYVLDNPDNFSIAIATSEAFAADLGMVMIVDLARFGNGFAEGGVKGIVQDIFRALSVIPAGRIAAGLRLGAGKLLVYVLNLKWFSMAKFAVCVPVSVRTALLASGSRFGLTLSEIAGMIGRSLDEIKLTGANFGSIAAVLADLKVPFRSLSASAFGTMDDLVRYAEAATGPIIAKLSRPGATFSHAVTLMKTPEGIAIVDQYGVTVGFQQWISQVAKGKIYSLAAGSRVYELTNIGLVADAVNQLQRGAHLFSVMVQSAVAVFDFNSAKKSPAKIKADFAAYVGSASGPEDGICPVPPDMEPVLFTHVVEGPKVEEKDWLSNIAKKWYGDMLLWPIIFDYNKSPDFTNPNKILVGQIIKVPYINDKTAEQLSVYRQRGLNWRQGG